MMRVTIEIGGHKIHTIDITNTGPTGEPDEFNYEYEVGFMVRAPRAASTKRVAEPAQTIAAGPGSGGLGVLSSGVIPFRQHTIPTMHTEPMPTFTAEQIPGLLTAAGFIKNNGSIDEAKYRAHPVSSPLGTVTSGDSHSMLFSGWFKHNGGPTDTIPHGWDDPFGTLTSHYNVSVLAAEWAATLAEIPLEDCYFRMMFSHEVGRGCGFDVDFGDHKGDFVVWGTSRDQVDGFGNAVSPPVGEWAGRRLKAIL